MSVPAWKRNESAVQYVDTARELYEHTLRYCRKFPKSATFLVTKDVVDAAKGVFVNVLGANRIYPKTEGDRAQRDEYVLTFDVHSYFASIRHDEAKAIFARRLADERLVRLCCQFVDEFKGDVGVGLGSELSQIIAICYLNGIDHLGEQNGAYGRYMDDGYLFGQRETVRAFASAIRGRLAALGLSLNDKTQVNRAREGATFLKRVYRDGKVMMAGSCRRNILRRVKKLRDVCDERREVSYQTYLAIVMETNEPRARFAILNWE